MAIVIITVDTKVTDIARNVINSFGTITQRESEGYFGNNEGPHNHAGEALVARDNAPQTRRSCPETDLLLTATGIKIVVT